MTDENRPPETTGEVPASQPAQPTPQPTIPVQPVKPGPSGMSIAALITGILSLICCGFFAGIPAIIIGKQEMKAIKEGRSNPEGYTLAQVGFILGIVGTVLTCLGALAYIAVMAFGISMGIMQEGM